MKEFGDLINITNIPKDMNLFITIINQRLSEEFIENHIDKIDRDNLWYYVFRHQKVSEKFIEKYIDKINSIEWRAIIINQELSKEFIKKHINIIYDKNLFFELLRFQKLRQKDSIYMYLVVIINKINKFWNILYKKGCIK